MIRARLVLVATLAGGCVDKLYHGPAAVDTAPEDRDGDGIVAAEDCDDADPAVYPGAEEVCDGADQDCDGWEDEGLPVFRWYSDEDGDGHAGTPAGEACDPPVAGAAEASTDCDDGDAGVNPSAAEVCNGVDDDCDGQTDVADDSWDPSSGGAWYPDGDGDGYGYGEPVVGCEKAPGLAASGDDCDDEDAAVYPGAPESCNYVDDNCDGVMDPEGTCAWTWADAVAHAVWYPETESQFAGYSVDVPGDFNLDGASDLVIGGLVSAGPPYAGAWITDGYGVGEQPMNAGTTIASFDVGVPGADFDSVLGCDLNDDGMLDVALGSVTGGMVYVVYSPSGSYVLQTDADAWLAATPYGGGGIGDGLACGDVDLDGRTELLAGAPYASPGGAVFIVDGEISGALVAEEQGLSLRSEHLGADAGSDVVVGDLTGDGVADVAIGADHLSTYYIAVGGAYIVEGPIASDMSLSDAESLLVGPWYADYAGFDIDLLADQDGDGISDLVIASYQHPYAYVVNGPAPPGTSQLEDADAVLANDPDFNNDAVTGGDFSADGLTDVVVGYKDLSKDLASGVRVLRGPLAGTVMMASTGEDLRTPTDVGLGRSVTTADVDGDGLDDLWAGATAYSGHGEYTGAGYLFLGSSL